ncbi:scarecrow-like protein 14 [Senna tora]|uniref:Scarecrow-like protein 14 n=1 Tax=Senna tora TaxID=362788 RepID=A0A834W194_9FABA|nr:scarecrow-like protein 14 [Senna tora]
MSLGSMDSSFFPSENYASPSTFSTDEDSPLDEIDFSGTVLRYINQMLMEEDMQEKPCMFHDSLALQAAEKSFYEVIGEKYPSSSTQHYLQNYHNVDDNVSGRFSDFSSADTSKSNDSQLSNAHVTGYNKPSIFETAFPANFVFQSNPISSAQASIANRSSYTNSQNGTVGSFMTESLESSLLSKSESVLQFERGVEEANKFLPKDNPLIINLESNTFSPPFRRNQQMGIKTEKSDREHLLSYSKGSKNHEREDETYLEDGRSNKQSAVYVDDHDLPELFDKVLLGTGCGKDERPMCISSENRQSGPGPDMNVQQNEESNKSHNGKARVKKQNKKKEVVDLRTTLILGAQAVSSDDRITSNELLKQIRQHSSPLGDGSQRLAHCFANALETRLAGTGTQIYTALSSKRTSAADMLKAYHMYLSACPFKKLAIIFANHTILSLAKGVETLHIVDFGIRYGFQWPALIYRLSKQPGGPPKLRITGIELPQPGFKPAERVQETGCRLARYCERFNVPFEYNAIAQKWETIKVEDLKIKENELVIVNCLVRFKNLLDETVVLNSPRDAVLNVIRQINPNVFIHTSVNGCYNAPFFVSRFREALFHYSSMFDMLDSNVGREDPMRLMFEKEFFGREVMNIVACEGCERIERPETYKQWQVRNMRAGFRQVGLDKQLINKLRGKLTSAYHSDFMLNEDGNWMLQVALEFSTSRGGYLVYAVLHLRGSRNPSSIFWCCCHIYDFDCRLFCLFSD